MYKVLCTSTVHGTVVLQKYVLWYYTTYSSILYYSSIVLYCAGRFEQVHEFVSWHQRTLARLMICQRPHRLAAIAPITQTVITMHCASDIMIFVCCFCCAYRLVKNVHPACVRGVGAPRPDGSIGLCTNNRANDLNKRHDIG